MKKYLLLLLLLSSMTFSYAQEVKILAYNVFLRPGPVGWFDYKKERFSELGEAVRVFDIVGLCEVFDTSLRKKWIDILRDTHPYVINPPKRKWSIVNGGIMFFSRYPITFKDQTIYKDADNWDQFADKGAIFARFQIAPNKTIEVVLTHAQAGGDYPHIRETQFQQMQELAAKNSSHPVFLIGDFNVRDSGDEYPKMRSIFQNPVDAYPLLKKDPGYTSNGLENPLTGGKTPKRIDYIFFKDPYKNLKMVDCSVNKFAMKNPVGDAKFMSDHYAVEVTTVVGEEKPKTFGGQMQITLEGEKKTGTLSIKDSKGQNQKLAIGSKMLLNNVAAGRTMLRLETQERIVNRIVEARENIELSLPFGQASCHFTCPKKWKQEVSLRLSGPFYWEKKLTPGAKITLENIPAKKYHLSLQIGEKTISRTFEIKPLQNLNLDKVLKTAQITYHEVRIAAKKDSLVALLKKDERYWASYKKDAFVAHVPAGKYKVVVRDKEGKIKTFPMEVASKN